MKNYVYSVFDKKARAYLQPFQAVNNPVAIRNFQAAVSNNPQSIFCQNPEDFELFHIGYFDDNSARYENVDNPIPVARALDFIKSEVVKDDKGKNDSSPKK